MARLGLENLKEGIRPQTNSLVVDENGCRGRGCHQNEVSSDYRILLGAVDAFASEPVEEKNVSFKVKSVFISDLAERLRQIS